MSTLAQRRTQHERELARYGQSHLLAFWDDLTDARRTELLDDIEQIDLARCAPLVDSYVRRRPEGGLPKSIEPARIYPSRPTDDDVVRYAAAREQGVAAIRSGKVAAFTVAGGQGTRLGFDGPKGAFRISPVRDACMFQLFAEFLRGVQRRYGVLPRWYIMTSPLNHTQTLAFFDENAHFGLSSDAVSFFQQRQMPAFHPDGRIALAEKHRVALSPDGHGGSLRALADSGSLADMSERGIEYISYFQVDNPLVSPIDPLFVGLHIAEGSEMSSKAVSKAYDLERVGNFCVGDGKLMVIEYSDLPEELARSHAADGSRRFDAGSIAIHVISRRFVERLTERGAAVQLPWHRADKKVSVVDEGGNVATPRDPNVVKIETFIFDAIPLAKNPLVMYTPREEEFSPVKNAEGDDSPATARRDLVRRAARWLEACGASVPRDEAGEPASALEISSAVALDADDLAAHLSAPPTISAGEPYLLA